MSQLHLDLKDPTHVVDFFVQSAPFVSAEEGKRAETLIKDYHDGKRLSRETLVEVAHELALASWPARYAIARYLQDEGMKVEWQRVIETVRPSTGQALSKLRKLAESACLEAALKQVEAKELINDDMALEIDDVRRAVREAMWQERQGELTQVVKDGEAELRAYEKRFERLRELAPGLPPMLQDEVFSKIAYYEDRILYAGEIVALEILDEEIKYYTDQAVSSPLEG